MFPAVPGLGAGEHLPPSPGRMRVVAFARAGCGSCDRTITELRPLATERDFDLIAVVAQATTATTAQGDGRYHEIADPDSSISHGFGVIHVPVVFLLDENSRVQAVVTGERTESRWRSLLGRPVDAH